jgi:drug/metabolite transporter (DMT)-like permease
MKGIEFMVIGSEIALALHPILLKLVNVPLITQVLFRMGTYSSLAGIAASPEDWMYAFGTSQGLIQSSMSSIMNLVHIGSSYASYRNLSAGSALALFYTYPFMNILAGYLFLGEKVSLLVLPLLLLAFVGVLLVSYAENTEQESKNGSTEKNTLYGISMALLSAMTETMIFLLVKTSKLQNPFVNILQLYPIGFLALALYASTEGFQDIKGSPFQLAQIIAFNVFIGFVGYSLRFYSIPRLSTVIFSILTFIGVAAGYGWGRIFASESPSLTALLGAACITGAVGILQLIKN